VSEWAVHPLGDCMAAVIDYRGKTPRKTTSGIPLVTAKVVKGGRIAPPDEFIDLHDYKLWMRRGIPEPGDVVITTEAPLGEVAQLGSERVALAQRLITLRGKPGVLDNTFLKFLLQSKDVQNQLRARATGTTVLGIKQSELRKVGLTLPPLNEQLAIARILGTLDDKIDLNRRMSETLEAMAQALFTSWFVDFGPVRAGAEGSDPPLPKHLADLFPDSFDDSDLGEVPKGWRVSRIGDEVTTVLGGTPSRAEPSYWGGDIPWINSGKANEFRVVEPSEFITTEGLSNSATKLLPSRTTVIAITGATLGQVSLTEIATCANQSIVGVIGKADFPSEFVYFWVRSRIRDLLASQTGGAQQHINKNNVNDLPVLRPSSPVINAYVRLTRPLFDRIKGCCFEARTLAALRDALLPKLISGELRVKNAEALITART
jgi:type I restriction enzyme S subunit